MPQLSQDSESLKPIRCHARPSIVCPFSTSTKTFAFPSPLANAVSSESRTRWSTTPSVVRRSTTTNSCVSRSIPSSRLSFAKLTVRSPTITRTKPSSFNSSQILWIGVSGDDFRSNATMKRVSDGSSRIRSAALCGVSRFTSAEQPWQKTRPILANKSRRKSVVSVDVPTVARLLRVVFLRVTAMAGGMPSMRSAAGFSSRSRNCRV